MMLNKQDKVKQEDVEFLADTKRSVLMGPKRFAHIILWIALVFFIVAIIWAKQAILDEVTTGQGKVIPSRQIQIVQNLEGGIVAKIYVREGQQVKKNQALMQIDDTRFSATYKEAKIKMIAFRLTVARLVAETEKKKMVISKDLAEKAPARVRAAKTLFETRISQLKQMEHSYNLARQELRMTKPLVKKGAASPVEVLRLERQANQLRGELLRFRNEALTELNAARAELASLKESIQAHQERFERTTVRSPMKGIIKKIHINTIGGVVQSGADLVEIVPLDDTLLIEAKIKPSDIGFLHPNQKAKVKISAYDFAIYGGLDGVVEQISADSISEKSNDDEEYYLVRVRTNKNYLGTKRNPLHIMPGMVATVDILTGEKSVLDYILKPILKARQKALRER